MLHVVVAVIQNKNGKILITQRNAEKHQGGKWEFPGGKVEQGESVQQALAREIDEELGIQIESVTPLIQIHHHYTELSVFLDVFTINTWQGEAYGKEGQPMRWVDLNKIHYYTFPVANQPILQALSLPDSCLITPEITDEVEFRQGVLRCLDQGITLIQLRAKTLAPSAYIKRATWLIKQCHAYKTSVLLNSPPSQLDCSQGLHLTSSQLLAAISRPNTNLLSAACHNRSELLKAQQLAVDFIFLSPIKATTSHPEAIGKGWQWFADHIKEINIPVYALGGLGANDIKIAKQNGAQGVAAISQLWQ
ncbi:MAG TPA: Nudix family hydrolase [Leucothrix mucor]|uniref:8-oxo-dGTP diphosphatase n=1 Tax=Leucothrix mucor TaxID=45248 RepID=A0A7V2WV60_LEUMU|nr:Nudix family hydrolase [Leucothrix mucor]